jgi:L-amino acid N-acyltransferase YncA
MGDHGRHEEAGGMSAEPDISIRRADADDAAGIADVLNEVIIGGRHSMLDTPFSVEGEREYIEALPERAFIHVAETPEGKILALQTMEPWSGFLTHEFDHVATMGTWVTEPLRRRGVGARLAQASFSAARAVGYEKVLTELRADNLESLAYHLSLGFVVVGTARRHARLNGRDIDVIFIELFLEG